MAEYRRALELKPDNANVHNNLGIALITRRDLDGAIAAYRRALELEPDYPEAHNNLGNALCNRGDLDGAVAAYRRALELRPDYANAHNNLGVALSERGDLVGAIAEFRRAVELRPDAGPHANLGDALKARGDLVGALAEYRRALELKPDWTALAQELRRCERLVELDGRLEAILRGEAKSGNPAETIEFALLCLMYKHRNAAAARLFTQAFADEPDLARDMNAQHRYNAVCAAVLSSSGQGNDATSLDDTECARLRQQALDWLRADLTAWIDQLGRASRDPNAESAAKLRAAVLRTLLHWQKDPDLANVRNAEALAHLPDAEREAWGKLWAEVANVVNSAAESR
jgi:Flp pilus assembly protein TadD